MLTNRIKELCQLDGICGWEEEIRNVIQDQARPHADKILVDSIGNLLVFKTGDKRSSKPILLQANMDEVGMIVRTVTEEGYIRIGILGRMDRRVAIGKKVRVGIQKYPGVVGRKAVHLIPKEDRKKVPEVTEYYVDIGALSKQGALEMVHYGDPVVFESSVVMFGENLLKAKAADTRASCAVLLEILEKRLPVDTWFVFSAQGEAGSIGMQTAIHRINPGFIVILDGMEAEDYHKPVLKKTSCRLGFGTVLPHFDKQTLYDRELLSKLREYADKSGVRWYSAESGSEDIGAGILQTTGGRVRCLSIRTPVRYRHTPAAVINIKDVEETAKMTFAFLMLVGDKANERD